MGTESKSHIIYRARHREVCEDMNAEHYRDSGEIMCEIHACAGREKMTTQHDNHKGQSELKLFRMVHCRQTKLNKMKQIEKYCQSQHEGVQERYHQESILLPKVKLIINKHE